jgi:hypothetical protein
MEILAIRISGRFLVLLALGAFNPALVRTVSAKRLPMHTGRNISGLIVSGVLRNLWRVGAKTGVAK